jgi:hypothetical protein
MNYSADGKFINVLENFGPADPNTMLNNFLNPLINQLKLLKKLPLI